LTSVVDIRQHNYLGDNYRNCEESLSVWSHDQAECAGVNSIWYDIVCCKSI